MRYKNTDLIYNSVFTIYYLQRDYKFEDQIFSIEKYIVNCKNRIGYAELRFAPVQNCKSTRSKKV